MGTEERRIGTIIGKWRVDTVLGSGSMAAVYAVTHRNGSRAALKVLHQQLCHDESLIERFLSEGYLANVVTHPGILRVFDDGMTEEGCPFLAMEMLRGETLEELRLNRGPKLDLDTTIGIMDSVLDVLSAVHAGGVIHRDLKPSNVFLTLNQEVKLLDFGVAKLSSKKSASKASLFGMVLGTPAYMAPEQAAGTGVNVDTRSDIFAVGAMLFTMLTGEHVHPVDGVQRKLLAAATNRARSIATAHPDLPEAIVAVVDRALQFKREDRWGTVDALRAALKEAHATAGAGARTAPDSEAFLLARPSSTPSQRPPSAPGPEPGARRSSAPSHASFASFAVPPPAGARAPSPSYPAFTGFGSVPPPALPPTFTGFASAPPPAFVPGALPLSSAPPPPSSGPPPARATGLPPVTTSRIVSISAPPPDPAQPTEATGLASVAPAPFFTMAPPAPPPAPAAAGDATDRLALSAKDTVTALEGATSKHEIGELVVDYLRSAYGCGLVLICREVAAVGWKGFLLVNIEHEAAPSAIASLEVPLAPPSVFRGVYEGRAVYKGAPPSDGHAQHARLWRQLGCPAPREVLVAPIVLGKRVVNLVYAHGIGGGALPATAAAELTAVCDAARDGYTRLIAKSARG